MGVRLHQLIHHWVKSHVGIVGNEIADKSANEGHHINCTVLYKLTREECFSDLRRAPFLEFWDVYWNETAALTSQWLFLRDVWDNVQQKVPQDITRQRVEIVIYLLPPSGTCRIGNLGAYLNRFNIKDSNLCKECKVSETVDHFFLCCRMYAEERTSVSDPMLNHVPKSVHFLDYLNFGALFHIFLWSICWNLCAT